MAGVARGAAPFPTHAFRVWIPRRQAFSIPAPGRYRGEAGR